MQNQFFVLRKTVHSVVKLHPTWDCQSWFYHLSPISLFTCGMFLSAVSGTFHNRSVFCCTSPNWFKQKQALIYWAWVMFLAEIKKPAAQPRSGGGCFRFFFSGSNNGGHVFWVRVECKAFEHTHHTGTTPWTHSVTQLKTHVMLAQGLSLLNNGHTTNSYN